MSFLSKFLNSSGILENSKIMEDYDQLFLDNEEIEVGFKLIEDIFIFTNKRLIVIERKKDQEDILAYTSLPYSQISYFTVEAKKSFDLKSVLKIWLSGQSEVVVEKEFNKSVDVYEVQKMLADHVL
ncbi:PH domain-containing protein [Marivirga sp.]|uniref:PH domain-containing protein n=1 Tax=Marivirga sp. TaxID=2018662 RepID=UPI003DA71AD9